MDLYQDPQTLYSALLESIVQMDSDQSQRIAGIIVNAGLNVLDAVENGIVPGMGKAGDLYEAGEYFIPDLLLCADAMNAAMDVFKPCLFGIKRHGRIVIGTVRGDTHDLGKNIVALVLESAGFDVLDLGRDVSARSFVDSADAFHADIIAVSALMTSVMNNIGEIVRLLEAEGKRDRYKIIIGGKPLSAAFARKVGADFYAESAAAGLRLARGIMDKKKVTV